GVFCVVATDDGRRYSGAAQRIGLGLERRRAELPLASLDTPVVVAFEILDPHHLMRWTVGPPIRSVASTGAARRLAGGACVAHARATPAPRGDPAAPGRAASPALRCARGPRPT